MSSNTAIYIYVGVSIIIMGVLVGFLVNCNNKTCSPYTTNDMTSKDMTENDMTEYDMTSKYMTENDMTKDICLCDKMGNGFCVNRQESINSYKNGKTEFQKFQKPSNFWSTSTNFNIY
jgi:hypothetical protein